jgi:hypothetical protein
MFFFVLFVGNVNIPEKQSGISRVIRNSQERREEREKLDIGLLRSSWRRTSTRSDTLAGEMDATAATSGDDGGHLPASARRPVVMIAAGLPLARALSRRRDGGADRPQLGAAARRDQVPAARVAAIGGASA